MVLSLTRISWLFCNSRGPDSQAYPHKRLTNIYKKKTKNCKKQKNVPWFLFYLAGHFRLASRPLRRLLLIRSAQPGRRSGDPTVRFPPFLSLPFPTRRYLVRSMSLPLSPSRSCMAGHVTMTTCYHNLTSTLLGAVRHATGRHSYEHNAEAHHTHTLTHTRTQTHAHTVRDKPKSTLWIHAL